MVKLIEVVDVVERIDSDEPGFVKVSIFRNLLEAIQEAIAK